MPELVGNNTIEAAAIAWVMELERAAGREPRDTRHSGAPADIESPPRVIELKAFGKSNRGFGLWLETKQVDEARRNPNFYVYVVENVRQGDPSLFTLKVLGGDQLSRLLERAKERRYYEMPWPVADYDTCPTMLGPSEPPPAEGERDLRHAIQSRVLGVDGYRGGWVAVELGRDGSVVASTARRFSDLLEADVAVIAVDIPIGIPEGATARAADAEARRFVGARASSVFTTPPRAALVAETFAEANVVARELTGKGLSQQSFALRHRILEVEALAEEDERIVEVHPEVSFCELAGSPLAFSKHTPEGLAERREMLEAAGIVLPDRPPGVPEADLLDAAVAAWTAARLARGGARSLPDGHTGRSGAIWV